MALDVHGYNMYARRPLRMYVIMLILVYTANDTLYTNNNKVNMSCVCDIQVYVHIYTKIHTYIPSKTLICRDTPSSVNNLQDTYIHTCKHTYIHTYVNTYTVGHSLLWTLSTTRLFYKYSFLYLFSRPAHSYSQNVIQAVNAMTAGIYNSDQTCL